MTNDSEQRNEALDPTRSFIVEAPAGSGKTSLLVQRYLRLLGGVQRPEAVVAMTFTRKAAAEMRERVLSALDYQNGEELLDEQKRKTGELAKAVLERDAALEWNLRSDPFRLQIQTIDSLCGMLARQMPVVSQLGGMPNVVENAAELYHLAARHTVQNLAESGPEMQDLFRRVSLHFDNDLGRLESQLARMLERRDQWHSFENSSDSQIVQDFCGLLSFAEVALRDVFREAGEVDFSEITRAALGALGTPENPSDLLYWLDYRIEHLLVDEFQDTSRSQYRLLQALTEQWSDGDGRTLFIVGDPMQSIYRFRDAEVGLFLKCWHGKQLGAVRLWPLRLTSNFRSTPEIVDWAQTTFATIMCEDDRRHGGVKLRPASAARPQTGIDPQLIPFVGDKGDAEADEVVKLAQASLQHGNVAILVRSRSQLASILPALRKAPIRYEAIEIDQLREEQHILDLISLSRALLHLGDRVSWLACLRAPWCGLNLSDLSKLAEGQTERTILDLVSEPERVFSLSLDGRIRAARTGEILSKAVSAVGHARLRDLVEQTWFALGGPAVLREASQREDVQTYLDLIEKFEEGGIIRDFSLLNEHLQFLFAKPVTGSDCVRIMTIHNAKGLEFDTVILPKLGMGARTSERDLLVWTEQMAEDGTTHLLAAAQPQRGAEDPMYRSVCDELDLREEHELKRLFYVAATRAKNRLYLLGNVDAKQDRSGCKKASSRTFLGLIWPAVSDQFEAVLRGKRMYQANLFSVENQPHNKLLRLPETWRAPKRESGIVWEPEFHRDTSSARKISYEWVSDSGRHIGTVVHAVLRRVVSEGVDRWSPERISKMDTIFHSELLRLGVSRAEEANAAAQVARALNNTLRSSKGRWILASHQDAHSEWSVGGRIGDKLISGTIDRTFRDGEGRLWIVDFKTSEHEGANLESFLSKEERRYRSQLESYATLISRMKPGPIFLGLYFPLLDAWREWRFEEKVGTPAHYTEN